MKRSAGILCVFAFAALLTVSSAARADCPDLNCEYLWPSPRDLYDLDHWKYYTWGMDKPWADNEEAVFVKLTIYSLRNWAPNDPNDLYIHLLDDAPLGVQVHTDNQGGGDAFDGQGLLLEHYHNLSNIPETKTIVFTPEQVAKLNEYAADGRFGLGFDPDCHFYNCGVRLKVCTQVIPEPATMGLLSLGTLPLLRRFRRRKKA